MNVRPDQDDIDASKAPLLDHLIELRTRLLWTFGAFAVAFVVCFIFADQIYSVLAQPLADALRARGHENPRLIFTQLQEPFLVHIRVAVFGAMCLAFPIAANQVWKFVAPGLYRNERQAFLPYLVATPVLFGLGAALVYFFVMPMAIGFFLSFEQPGGGGGGGAAIELEARVADYLDLVMVFIFAFGVCFQLPVVLVLLGQAGLVTAAQLRQSRRYAVVLVFIAAALLTPPDIGSQVGLAVPMLLLYEVSIWLVALFERRRAAASAQAQAGS